MDPTLEIQPARILSFDPSSSSEVWEEYSTSQIDDPSLSSRSLTSFIVATWNVWEDDRFIEYRHPFILRKLFEEHSPPLDVITLQEVTTELFDSILAHPTVQNEWLVTDLKHQLDICPNPYGTVILIRKSVARGHACASGFHEFENTRMGRGLNFIELCSRSSRQPLLRIGTSHFESHPEDKRKRREQFEVSAEILTSKKSFFLRSSSGSTQSSTAAVGFVPAILTGDCNICSYDELNPLLSPAPESPAFIDAFLAARPIQADDSPFNSHPTFGVTITNRRMFGRRNILGPRRLDYIFVRGFEVAEGTSSSEGGTIGEEAVCKKEDADDEEGRDGRVYASDHLGVWVCVRPPSVTLLTAQTGKP